MAFFWMPLCNVRPSCGIDGMAQHPVIDATSIVRKQMDSNTAIGLCILAVLIVVPLYWFAVMTGGRR